MEAVPHPRKALVAILLNMLLIKMSFAFPAYMIWQPIAWFTTDQLRSAILGLRRMHKASSSAMYGTLRHYQIQLLFPASDPAYAAQYGAPRSGT